MKCSNINLALPRFIFFEPTEVDKIESLEYDPIAMAAVKSIPEAYTIYDKILVNTGSSLTLQQLFTYLADTYKISIILVAAGTYGLYNSLLAGNPHKDRLD